jgi:glucose-1-phosphate adenylyltransferase
MKALGKKYLASMGIYIFNRKLLFDLLLNEFKDATDFGKEIIPKSIGKYKVASYQYTGYWEDIGNIRAFYEANLALTKDLPDFNLFDKDRAIFTRPRMLPPAKITGSTLVHSIVSEGSIIMASRVENSIVGIRSRIGEETVVLNSYLMGSDFYETLDDIKEDERNSLPLIGIGKRCHIEQAIIDKDCRIGNDVKIKGGLHLEVTDNELYTVKEGIVVVKKGAVLPDGFTIG